MSEQVSTEAGRRRLAEKIEQMRSAPVPPTIVTDDAFREVYCQGYRHALGDMLKASADVVALPPEPSRG